MTGAYLVMDGGVRDAGGISGDVPDDLDDPATQERLRHQAASEERTQRLQPLIDQR